jgi:hypothetical protein
MAVALTLVLAALLPALTTQTSAAIGTSFYVLTADNRIAIVTEAVPSQVLPVAVSGLGTGETLAAIDVRPQNGQLYGVTLVANGVKLYHISIGSGTPVATQVGASVAQFVNASGASVPITGTVGIDFNPTVDRLRLVTSAGQNLRLNPNNGAAVDGDPTAAGIQPDGSINGPTTGVNNTAYTNNAPNVSATTQYTIDTASDRVFIQNPPNSGTQTNPLPLTLRGAPLDASGASGFDIPAGVNVTTSNQPAVGIGYAALTVGGVSGLYRINLATGEAVLLGALGGLTVTDIAITPSIPTGAVLRGDGLALLRMRLDQPGTLTSVNITGVTAGEVLVGIDGRPATGQLFGLGVNEAANTATLYLIDPQSSATTATATPLGTPGQIAFVDASGMAVDLPPAAVGYGVDFNPTVDRLRVVTGSGLNFRVNPNDGAPVDGNLNNTTTPPAGINPDGPISGLPSGSTGVDATAYTNNFASPTGSTPVTTQYTLDSVSNRLFIQNLPNAGTQTTPLAVTLNNAALDFTAANGFDIPPGVTVTTANAVAQGEGFAALTVGGSIGLYRIDLATGAATLVGPLGDGTTAVGGLVAWNAPQRFSTLLPTVFN